MRIDRIELYHVAMPLIYPWRTAYGEDAAIHALLCRLTSGSNEAWGEAGAVCGSLLQPGVGRRGVRGCERLVGPCPLGSNNLFGEDLQRRLSLFKGNPFAKSAFDTAWWALRSRASGIALHRLLGATRDQVAVGADFGVMDSIDELLTGIGSAVEARFPRIKLKFRPGWDLEMLRAVRREFPTQTFHIDCNSGYRLTDLPMFQELDDFDLAMIEQPLQHDDLVDHAALQAQIKTPVCLDESITHPREVEQAISLKSCRYVNVKPGRVGGLTNAVKIHDICQAAGIPCWVGGMLESATGAAFCAALAMLDNFTYPADIFPSSRFYHEDLADPPLELVRLADGTPGIAAFQALPEPGPARLARLTVEKVVLKA